MRIEIISVGDELRFGEIADTNAQYLAARLSALGLEVVRTCLVGDERGEVASAFREAIARADVILATGGLGPTEDDLTREGLADALGVEVVESPEAREMLERRRRTHSYGGGRELNEMDLRQARLPAGAEPVPNPRGSAPGIRLERPAAQGGRLVFVMPGVPAEMKGMFEEQVCPEVLRRAARSATPSGSTELAEARPGRGVRSSKSSRPGRAVRSSKSSRPGRAVRHLVVFGIREAEIAARLADTWSAERGVRLGTRATDGVITVRVVARGADTDEAERLASSVTDEVKTRLRDGLVAEGDRTLAEIVAAEATENRVTLSLAESCTGGMIAEKLVAVPGVSSVLIEGVVAYSNEAKVRRLGVPPGLVREKGAVSGEVARAMAEGARLESGADCSVAVTGIAGPAGGGASGGEGAKPVGLTYLAASSRLGCEVIERRFPGDREQVRRRATQTALWLLLQHVRRHVRADKKGTADERR